ncbi:hypothetical protein E4U43_001301 [Claviceps pusilla]|uniref:AAR2 protein n=1 Tax=Claviceps pusilla TaxID=123648 RepID=A0A9P7NA19_9HYPO|nr:hypothetical protein E4U43_001301 [Claviceps pusilla]
MDTKSTSSSTTTPRSKGITKSNSTASAGARSTKSHESVSVVGPYPLGTLRVLRPESSPRTTTYSAVDQDDDIGPPPLEPAIEDAYQLSGSHHHHHHHQQQQQQHQQQHRHHHSGCQTSLAGPSSSSSLASLTSSSSAKRTRGAQAHSMGGGDVAIIIDLPDVFTVGYDALSFTAQHFGGVRDIPEGPHFFWVTHPSGVAARAGVWLLGSQSRDRVHVVQWDKYNENLTEALSSEARNHAENVPNIHAKLIPYSDPSKVGDAVGQLSASKIDANLAIWTQLTTSITSSLLDRITGPQSGGWIVHTLDRGQGVVQFSAEVHLERLVPNKNLQQRQLKFTFERTTRLFSLEARGSDRSLEAMDPTKYLLSRIEDPSNDLVHDDLVGELQFSFIVGMLLGNDACLDQWWFMVLKLLVKSHLLVEKQPLLAAALWRSLTAQITFGTKWLETTALDPEEQRCRELRIGLIIYKRRLEEFLQSNENLITPDHLGVSTAFSRLESALTDLGWDLITDYVRRGILMLEDGEEVELELSELDAEDERGEWAPEIVELDEHGHEFGLVSWD